MTETTLTNAKNAPDARHAAIEMPLVSAIIPTHNRAEMLARAIRSVQSQTYPHLEIIVVDDASQDNTREVAESFSDPRIRYIRHDTNRGGSAARNTGIRVATGEFIAFLDDDDEWEPEKTEEQLKVLQDYAAAACTCEPITDNVVKSDSHIAVEHESLRRGDFKFTSGGTGSLMANANVLKEIMFDESLPRNQDWDLFIRIALKHRIWHLSKPLLRPDSGTHRRISNSVLMIPLSGLEAQFRMIHKHRQFFGDTWYKRHMCNGLLYGIRQRPDKLALLAYIARRYGLINIVRAWAIRVGVKLRKSFSRAAPAD